MRRIEFQSTAGDGYALAREGERPADAVGRSIARRTGGRFRSARLDSWAPGGEYQVYEYIITARGRGRAGDAVPFRNVRATVYR